MATAESHVATRRKMSAMVRRMEAAGDRRCIFLRTYLVMTREMGSCIERGVFRDGAWIERLLVQFAEYYFAAYTAYDSGAAGVPGAWGHAHDGARSPSVTTPETLLLGINAHINNDLPLSLFDVLHREWPKLSSEQRRERARDHDRVNSVIADTVALVQTQVMEGDDRRLG